MIQHIAMTLPRRVLNFDMDLDPSFIADATTRILLDRDGCCEPEVVHLMNNVLREGDVAIDVGANIGFFTLLMSRLVGDTGRVIAFEPGPNNIHKLKVNIAANKLTNVDVHEVVLWDKSETVTLHMSTDSGMNSLTQTAMTVSSIPMRAKRLESFMRYRKPRLAKIDVEGAEEHVLKGACLLLQDRPPFIVCELNASALARLGSSPDQVRAYMTSQGYDTFLLPRDGNLPTLLPPNTQIVSTALNLNVLFSTVHDVGSVYNQVKFDQPA